MEDTKMGGDFDFSPEQKSKTSGRAEEAPTEGTQGEILRVSQRIIASLNVLPPREISEGVFETRLEDPTGVLGGYLKFVHSSEKTRQSVLADLDVSLVQEFKRVAEVVKGASNVVSNFSKKGAKA
jgi:hypothetical protein